MTTAAEPAPYGSAARNGGEIASPQTTRYSPPCATSAASSPSTREALDQLDVALAEQAGRRSDRRRPAPRDPASAALNHGPAGPGGGGQRRAVDVRRRAARSGGAGRRGRLAAARGRRPRDARRADAPVGGARRPDRGRQRRGGRADGGRARRARWRSRRPARWCPGCATGCCCTRARRSSGRAPATRSGARLSRLRCSRAGRAIATDAAPHAGSGRDRARTRQRARPRGADDRRLLAVDAGVGGGGRAACGRSRR